MIAPVTVPMLGPPDALLSLPPLAPLGGAAPEEEVTSTHALCGSPTVAEGAGADGSGTVITGTEPIDADRAWGCPLTAMEEETGTLEEVLQEEPSCRE